MSPERYVPDDVLRALQAIHKRLDNVERARLLLPPDADALQTFESGSPLGDTRFLNFGAGINASLVGDDYVLVEGAGAGTRWGTVVVAASDTHQAGRDQADFVCTGAADQTTLDLALDAAPSGGEIVLLEGTYNLSAPWVIDTNNIHVRGMGVGTLIRSTAGGTHTIAVQGDDVWLSNFKMLYVSGSLNIAVRVNGSGFDDCLVDGVTFDGFPGSGVRTNGVRWRVLRCRFSNCGVGVFGDNGSGDIARGVIGQNQFETCGTGISAQGSHVAIVQNVVHGCTSSGIRAAHSSSTVVGNVVQSVQTGINTEATDCVISGNVVRTCTSTGITCQGTNSVVADNRVENITTDGIILSNGCTCNGNYIKTVGRYGIDSATNGILFTDINGNIILFSGWHSIYVNTDSVVVDNLIYGGGTAADNTYDGIHVIGDRTNIQGNLVRHGGGAVQFRYGINISAASCDDNLVCNNDLINAGRTAKFNDSGTGTRKCPNGELAGSSSGGGIAPSTADYLVGTANADLSAEIVVGTTPGGELGNTWAAPTVDATHSGSAHTDFIANALVDAKGDVITATADNTPVRKAVGADGTALVASAAAGDGLVWGTPAVLNSAAATTLGTVVGKVEIFDAAGVSLGFLPVYDAIT